MRAQGGENLQIAYGPRKRYLPAFEILTAGSRIVIATSATAEQSGSHFLAQIR
jgi:hypothetical protein